MTTKKMKKMMTLVLVHKGDEILLGMKKRGFGEGKYNGFGGKMNDGEGIEAAASRELREEVNIIPNDLQKFGVLDFDFVDTGESLEVHFFVCREFEGEPIETDEMKPKWFDIEDIPFDMMWPDDRVWFPMYLQDKKFIGRFLFSSKDTKIIDYHLSEVDDINSI